MRIAILGAGAWGSALAASFAASHEVTLWSRSREDCAALAATRRSRYLPAISIPAPVRIEASLDGALGACELAIYAAPTAGLRETLQAAGGALAGKPLVWACKGFEDATGALPHEVAAQAARGASALAALSGPSFALEVARGQPTAVVLASRDPGFAQSIAAALNSARLRIYSNDDLIGVELGGALKNVVAIAAGISDGLALGRNARAALVTRGLAEISRLGTAMGGRPETFMGLAGLGDLVLTCTGDLSRHREVGVRLAQGGRLAQVLESLGHVAEGVHSARAAREHARRLKLEMPITEAVCSVLFEDRPAPEAVRQLLTRDPRPE
ncbi:MAG TPA: NAD(P)H-dependent glycerol-3-phosphate dehydrogenase [Usitatibacter sp.]|nr:NAD(P)H-dependent glycerol-3-phosphate dehydrogenase [Usitatibacter sp.]